MRRESVRDALLPPTTGKSPAPSVFSFGLKERALNFDMTDEVTSGTLLTHDGKVVHAPTAQRLGV